MFVYKPENSIKKLILLKYYSYNLVKLCNKNTSSSVQLNQYTPH